MSLLAISSTTKQADFWKVQEIFQEALLPGSPKNDLTLKVAKILADCDKDKSFDLTFEELKVCYVS